MDNLLYKRIGLVEKMHFFDDMADVLKKAGHRLLTALSCSHPAPALKRSTVRFAAMWIIIKLCRFAGVFSASAISSIF